MTAGVEVPTHSDVAQRVENAVASFNATECGFIGRDPSERALTHRFAVHLERQFQGWDVDCEYNRDGIGPKELNLPDQRDISSDETEARTVFPDIIVHKRGSSDNLLVLEAKKVSTRHRGLDDKVKLQAFVAQLGYRNAALLVFQTDPTKPRAASG